ncbi:hypothetical protein MY11210_006789 [Beauveria gryllotalpidicola]
MSWQDPSSPPSTKPETSYVFQVVVKVNGIYCPISIVTELPPEDKYWLWADRLWIADRARLMYQFLSNKDPAARFKLQAEVDLAIEENTQYPFWFRNGEKQLCEGPHIVDATTSSLAMRDPESIWYPYTTLGIVNCIPRRIVPGGDDESVRIQHVWWTQNSLRTVIENDAKYTIVVFDITDLDNISLAVLSNPSGNNRQVETMNEHCMVLPDAGRHPVTTSLAHVPRPGSDILQQTMDRIFQDDVRLASIAELNCKDLIKAVLSAPKVVRLSFSSTVLRYGTDLADIEYLMIVLSRLEKLEAVYITDPVGIPGGDLRGTLELARSAADQGLFFAKVLCVSKKLWWKLHASSMYSWRLSTMLYNCMDEVHAKMVTDRVYGTPEGPR